MRKISSRRGMISLRLTSADTSGMLGQLNNHLITIYDAVYIDSIHLQITIFSKDLPLLQEIMRKRGDAAEIIHGRSILCSIREVCKRPVLVLGLLGILFLSLWLPTRVFFVRVEGNNKISDQQIIEQAKHCGIDFGVSRRQVRSEAMKNRLLSAMPELQWAGITTSGCTAIIAVRERNVTIDSAHVQEFHSIVALRDAVLGSMVVQKGTALCQAGQAVKEGQLLVSPYEDCGLCIRATGAQAEIFGQTQRQLAAVCPSKCLQREEIASVTKKYSLIIGKKRINFYKGSGISGGTCAKIYEEKYFTLPGGFVLPVAIVCEQIIEYQSQLSPSADAEEILEQFAQSYLSELMESGKILVSNQVYFHGNDFCRLEGAFSCYEIIGIARPEEHRKAYE